MFSTLPLSPWVTGCSLKSRQQSRRPQAVFCCLVLLSRLSREGVRTLLLLGRTGAQVNYSKYAGTEVDFNGTSHLY
ncbi:hypothetical protein MKW98_010579 [Papaver atlanticum]|uniref:Uncharacterized protein n=1 Tax=Papaver atlanticum TaxID=357466 RepID=A0AAD4X7Y8_9MAGN|nr:hypothetical protein MKW98_010579 [Papaver atlanticum]